MGDLKYKYRQRLPSRKGHLPEFKQAFGNVVVGWRRSDRNWPDPGKHHAWNRYPVQFRIAMEHFVAPPS
jgi:hypothetical protein